MAGDLGFSELTIEGLLGHVPRGMIQGYAHLDSVLVVTANQVLAEIARALDATEGQVRPRFAPIVAAA